MNEYKDYLQPECTDDLEHEYMDDSQEGYISSPGEISNEENVPIAFHHYVSLDTENCIIDGWSDGPHPEKDTSEAICINEKGDYQFRLFTDGEENPSLYTREDFIPLYKWDGENVVHRTNDEIEADREKINSDQPIPEPTEMERIRADLDYVMLMNGLDVDPK